MEKAIKKAIEGGYENEQINAQRMVGVKEIKVKTNGFGTVAFTAEDGGTRSLFCRREEIVCDPLFWQALGRACGWGGEITTTKTGKEYGERFCLHCSISTQIQPPKETGCNHIHYPEYCTVCEKKNITWQKQWHNFIGHLIAGKDINSFFETLWQE